jgi:hypothetical protein
VAAIEDRVAAAEFPEERVLAIFTHLDGWFHEPPLLPRSTITNSSVQMLLAGARAGVQTGAP